MSQWQKQSSSVQKSSDEQTDQQLKTSNEETELCTDQATNLKQTKSGDSREMVAARVSLSPLVSSNSGVNEARKLTLNVPKTRGETSYRRRLTYRRSKQRGSSVYNAGINGASFGSQRRNQEQTAKAYNQKNITSRMCQKELVEINQQRQHQQQQQIHMPKTKSQSRTKTNTAQGSMPIVSGQQRSFLPPATFPNVPMDRAPEIMRHVTAESLRSVPHNPQQVVNPGFPPTALPPTFTAQPNLIGGLLPRPPCVGVFPPRACSPSFAPLFRVPSPVGFYTATNRPILPPPLYPQPPPLTSPVSALMPTLLQNPSVTTALPTPPFLPAPSAMRMANTPYRPMPRPPLTFIPTQPTVPQAMPPARLHRPPFAQYPSSVPAQPTLPNLYQPAVVPHVNLLNTATMRGQTPSHHDNLRAKAEHPLSSSFSQTARENITREMLRNAAPSFAHVQPSSQQVPSRSTLNSNAVLSISSATTAATATTSSQQYATSKVTQPNLHKISPISTVSNAVTATLPTHNISTNSQFTSQLSELPQQGGVERDWLQRPYHLSTNDDSHRQGDSDGTKSSNEVVEFVPQFSLPIVQLFGGLFVHSYDEVSYCSSI
ncbi:unnamed protein product [Thelazia callipaeda]|uniref:PAM2 domain-containing protein n=1 Tax=Thelazia callipaeda TaxID=103827 RepID=A0A0N5CXL1_THECL|nr:unnamed protein product [Thelazia callipaeda]